MAGVCLPSLILFVMDVQQMADYSLPASALSGGLNVVGTLLNNAFQKSAADKAYKRNLEMMREQNAFNKNMMLLSQKYNTNERLATQGYNSASAQVSRLRAAGLNPLMGNPDAGSSSPMSSSMASSASGNLAQIPHTEPLNLGQSIPDLLLAAQVKNDMRVKLIEAGAAARNAATNEDVAPKNAESQRISSEASKVSAEAAAKNAETNKSKTEHEINQIDEQVKYQQLVNEWYPKLMDSNLKVNDAQARNLVNSIALGFARLNFDKMVQDWNQRFNVEKTKFDAKIHSADQRLQLDMFNKELKQKYDQLHSQIQNMNIDKNLRSWALLQLDQKLQYELDDLPMWVKSGSQVFKNIMSVGAILK